MAAAPRSFALAFVAGCFPTEGAEIPRLPAANETLILVAGEGMAQVGVLFDGATALPVSRDDPILALYFRASPADLQVDREPLSIDGERALPEPDEALAWIGGEWVRLEAAPELSIRAPPYDVERCAASQRCFADGAMTCSIDCAPPEILAVPEVRTATGADISARLACADGSAHFLGEASCRPIGACDELRALSSSVAPGDLQAILASSTSTVIGLREGRFRLSEVLSLRGKTIVGCGGGTILDLEPEAALSFARGGRLADVRIEGGDRAIIVGGDAEVIIERVSVAGSGVYGIDIRGPARLAEVSIEKGRGTALSISRGRTEIAALSVVSGDGGSGVVCSGSDATSSVSAALDRVSIVGGDWDIDVALQIARGCDLAASDLSIEELRGLAVRVDGRQPPAGSARLSRVHIRNVRKRPSDLGAAGIQSFSGARLVLEHATIEDVDVHGVFAWGGRIDLFDVIVRRIDGVGVHASGNDVSSATAALALVSIRETVGHPLSAAGALVDASDLDVLGEATDIEAVIIQNVTARFFRARIVGGSTALRIGDPANLLEGEVVTADTITIGGGRTAGIRVHPTTGTIFELNRAVISDGMVGFEIAQKPLTTGPSGTVELRQLAVHRCGTGLAELGSADLTLEAFDLSGNDVGLVLDSVGTLDLANGSITDNVRVGADVSEVLPREALLRNVLYRGNGRDLFFRPGP